jgi:hypothetical protein
MSDITQEAIAAIGSGEPGDWELRPETHAQTLPPEAGALKRVLANPAFLGLTEKYRHFDTQAARFQNRYKRHAKAAAIAGFLAIFFGCVLLLLTLRPVFLPLNRLVTVLQAALVVTSFLLTFLLTFTKPFNSWMEARGEAENARLHLFAEVLKAQEAKGDAQPGELPLLPLQLEYLRRYLHDTERAYYSKRGKQHQAASRKARNWRILAFFIVLVSMIFPAGWAMHGVTWLPAFLQEAASWIPPKSAIGEVYFLSVGIVASALQGLLAAYALISLDDRNAARYLVASENLEALSEQPLADARTLAASGNRSGVLDYAELLRREISSEHSEWIALRKIAPSLRLEELTSLRLLK